MMAQYTFLVAVALLFSACGVEDLTVSLNDTYSCEAADDIKIEMLKAVNEARSISRQCGEDSFEPASQLSWDRTLAKAAQVHSDDMAEHDFVSHTGSDGSTPGDRVINSGYTWDISAENISAGVQTSKETVENWLTSPGHCANIMHPDLKEMGAACSRQAGTKYVTYWTQELATSY